jgi:transposase
MLGLDGFVLIAVSSQHEELEQAVETTATEDFCRGCGVQARLHDRRPTWVRDLPAGGRPVTLPGGHVDRDLIGDRPAGIAH